MKQKMGRPTIFPGAKCMRVQALITKVGKQKFEAGRRRLAVMAKLKPDQVSDAAVVEYLARGEDATRALLAYAESARE